MSTYICLLKGTTFFFLASIVEFHSLGAQMEKKVQSTFVPVNWDDQQALSVDLSCHSDRCHFSNVNTNVFKSRSIVDIKKVKVIQVLNPF